MEHELSVRRMSEDDLNSVVSIHVRAFDTFFLTSLGHRFLKLFYGYCSTSAEIALVATDTTGEIAGFVVGTTNARRLFVGMARLRPVQLGLSLLPAIVRQPMIILRLGRRWSSVETQSSGPAITLLSIATDPTKQRRGIGRRLLARFYDEACELSAASIELTTDALANMKVNAFYLENGFRLIKQYVTAEGRAMNVYSRDVSAR